MRSTTAEFAGLVRLAMVLVDSQEQAEEVVQDAFAALYLRYRLVSTPLRLRARVGAERQPQGVASADAGSAVLGSRIPTASSSTTM